MYINILACAQFFGLRPRETQLCEELARRGFIAIAPDTYGGQTTNWIPRAISLVLPAVTRGQWDPHLRAVNSAVSYALEAQQNAELSKVSICGFCFGGGVAARYAQQHPERVRACGIFYGKPLTDDASGMPPVYAVFGGQDTQFSPQVVDEFEGLLRSSGVETEFRRYPDQGHAFVSDVGSVRQGGDAQNAWEGWLAFCQKHEE
jgi:carboxymethylenebutenolidase